MNGHVGVRRLEFSWVRPDDIDVPGGSLVREQFELVETVPRTPGMPDEDKPRLIVVWCGRVFDGLG